MVNSTHPDYIANLVKWQRCRHVMAGEDAVKAAGESYLPKLGEQTLPEYEAYKLRALFFNATSRTVDSFVGMAFRKQPTEEIPEALQPMLADINLQGQGWREFQKYIVREVVSLGRAGSFIEWSNDEARPYVCTYDAESVLNWRTARIAGQVVLSMVVLQERVERAEADKLLALGQSAPKQSAPAKGKAKGYDVTSNTGPAKDQATASDEYQPEMVNQIRVLKLDTSGATPVFKVEIWRKNNGDKNDYVLLSTYEPKRKGEAIQRIPFVFHGPNNLAPAVDRPPIDDIVAINLSHYRTYADLEHGRHYTGLPTPVASGFDTNKTYSIGSATAWVSSDPTAKASFLEFTGQGLQALEKAIEQKEHQMAVLGARMLQQEKKAVETAEVARMKQTGEQASLSQIVQTSSEGFTQILRWFLWWQGTADYDFKETGDVIKIALNTDFDPSQMPPLMITALVNAANSGYLAKDSVVAAFKRGELLAADRTVEEELELIAAEMPKLDGKPNENV